MHISRAGYLAAAREITYVKTTGNKPDCAHLCSETLLKFADPLYRNLILTWRVGRACRPN